MKVAEVRAAAKTCGTFGPTLPAGQDDVRQWDSTDATAKKEEEEMTTFILVPGSWKGGWAFESVVPLLERAGHDVRALTLSGLRPGDDTATIATANLDAHADDVL